MAYDRLLHDSGIFPYNCPFLRPIQSEPLSSLLSTLHPDRPVLNPFRDSRAITVRRYAQYPSPSKMHSVGQGCHSWATQDSLIRHRGLIHVRLH